MGGDYNWEGRVEIFYSGTWSAISDTSWTSSDATVVCRELRHSTEGMYILEHSNKLRAFDMKKEVNMII